jgi:iron-sulfur cluster repair protein YtfE (RIC family)
MRERNDALQYPIDAIAMLKADHRFVHDLFAQYASARDFSTKQVIAEQVFTALEVHAQLEDNIFYPAYETMTGKNGTQVVADSRLAHEHVMELLIELRGINLQEEEFEEQFQELRHTVEQHVAQEEDEMFPEAEQILADRLADLRDNMVALKQQLMTAPRQ